MDAKERMRAAALQQVEAVAHEVPEDHRESSPGKTGRTERIVIRVSPDELRRVSRYFEEKNLPLSTGARAALLDLVRRG